MLRMLRQLLAKLLRILFGGASDSAGVDPSLAPAFNPDPDFSPALDAVPRYPPFDHGLPFVLVADVIQSQQSLITRLRDANLPFALEAVENLAGYVHLLPATTNDFFCGAGGLFRLCLETGYHSYVASQGSIFTGKDPAEKRRELEPKWQLASFLAGLCCELGRAISTSVVTNDQGQIWLPFEPLTAWLTRTEAKRYFLRPPEVTSIHSDPSHLSTFIFNSIIPRGALLHITTEDRSILMSMLEAVSRLNETYGADQFVRSIRNTRDRVIARDQKTNPITFGKPLVGMHLEPHLLGAMRALVNNKTWKINQKLARLQIASDGAYLFWTTGVTELLDLLREQGAVGIPNDARTLGEMLMGRHVFVPNVDGNLWWHIRLPGGSPTTYEVVKLANPGIILDEQTLASVQIYSVPIAVMDHDRAGSVTPEAVPNAVAPSSSAPTSSPIGSVLDEGGVPKSPHLAAPGSNEAVAAQYHRALNIAAGASEGRRPSQLTAQPAAGAGQSMSKRPPKPRKIGQDVTSTPAHTVAPDGNLQNKESPHLQNSGPGLNAQPSASAPTSPASQPAPVTGIDYLAQAITTPSVLRQVSNLRDLHNANSNSGMFWLEHGLAIPLEVIRPTGDHMDLLQGLREADAIYVAPGETKKIHKFTRGDVECRAIVIPRRRAIEFGFNAGDA